MLCGITQEELFASFQFESSNLMMISCISVSGYYLFHERLRITGSCTSRTLVRVLVSKRYGCVAGSSSAYVGRSLGLKRSLVTQVVMKRLIKAKFIRLSFCFRLLFFKSAYKILYHHLLKLDLILLTSTILL